MANDVLIVSPDPAEIKILKSLFSTRDLKITDCSNDQEALKLIKDNPFSLVMISPLGEGVHGLSLKKNIQHLRPETEVILLTNFKTIRTSDDVLHYGASDYILHLEDLRRLLIHSTMKKGLETPEDPEEMRIKDFFFNLTDLLVGILEIDDKYFSGNTHTVMKLSRQIAERMGLNRKMIDSITLGSLLRDLGKIGVKQQILNETRELTEDELMSIKDHCQTSLKLLKRLNLPWRVDQVIQHHHESYDGSGYPSGLKGREIPLGARILSVVDSYVAMTTDRPYRKAMNGDSAVEEIQQKAGTIYDPEVVEIFLSVIQEDWKRNADSKERLLVVDDEKYIQTLIKLHMVNEGFEVMTAENGAEAIMLIKQKRPSLIVSDVEMPLMDGYTLCRALSQDPAFSDIPFIFLSSHKDPDDRIQGLRLGAMDYITKPFDLEELSLKINTLLKREKKIRRDPDKESGIKGRLEDMPLQDIAQILNLGLKTAKVEIHPDTEENHGEVFFSRGEVTAAYTDGLDGEKAFNRMLRWNAGNFKIRHGIQSKVMNIAKTTMGLLMDGVKLIDEENRDRDMQTTEERLPSGGSSAR